MAGHSKWAQIKRHKAVQDAKKGERYAKYTREIIMATKIGGPDPAGNFRLRTAIEHAKAAGLTRDLIKGAVAKGSGAASGDALETIHYEGYGPGGVAVYIEAMTDNRNRTAGDIRSYFNKYNGNLGETGSVGWIFLERGQITIQQPGLTEEDLLEALMDVEVEDLMSLDEVDSFEVVTPPDSLNDVCKHLAERQITITSAESTRIAQNTITVADETVAKPLLKLLDIIESHDDVQTVYANFDMDEALLATCSPA